MKKIILFVLLSVVLIGCKNDKEYLKSANMTIINMIGVRDVCNIVSNSYVEIWQKTLTGGFYDGRYFSNFSEAIAYKYGVFKDGNTIDNLDKLMNDIEEGMKVLSNPSSKAKEIHENLIKMYSIVKRYSDLVKSPEGSLLSYSNECRQLSSDFSKLYDETKIRMLSFE